MWAASRERGSEGESASSCAVTVQAYKATPKANHRLPRAPSGARGKLTPPRCGLTETKTNQLKKLKKKKGQRKTVTGASIETGHVSN